MCGRDAGDPVFVDGPGTTTVAAIQTGSPAGCGVRGGNSRGSRVDSALPWIRSQVPAQYGFVRATSPTSPTYTPAAAYSYNSTGATNKITRSSTGQYHVTMPGLGLGGAGNVQVIAYGGSGNRCVVGGWSGWPDLDIFVICSTPAGAYADVSFVAQFYVAGSGDKLDTAYLVDDLPTASAFVPTTTSGFNSKGGSVSVTRDDVGKYTVEMSGFAEVGGNVAVTAWGSTANLCVATSWDTDSIGVWCYGTLGQAADTAFSVRYTAGHVAGRPNSGAYMLANDKLASSYTPAAATAYHSVPGSVITAGNTGTGAYSITIPNMKPSNRTSVMVTAQGGSDYSCGVVAWVAAPGGGTTVLVKCFDVAGALQNSFFSLSYVTN
jgi:hypothetical protein